MILDHELPYDDSSLVRERKAEAKSNIRVEDAIGMRDALESLIATAVQTFEEETGLEVTGIYVPMIRDGRKLKITTVLPAKKAEIVYPF
jgi:hypothetical protein